MINGNCILLTLLVIYCMTSIIIFTKRLIYFIRCTYDSSFREKQPVLWSKITIQDMILTITFTWLPVLIIEAIVYSLKN